MIDKSHGIAANLMKQSVSVDAVYAHTTAGHTTWNPYLVRIIPINISDKNGDYTTFNIGCANVGNINNKKAFIEFHQKLKNTDYKYRIMYGVDE